VTLPEPARPKRVYRFPLLPLMLWLGDFLLARPRSFARDSRITLNGNLPPPCVQGVEHLPPDGTFILVMNHYERNGLLIHFCAMAVSVAVADRRPHSPEVRWVITSEWYGRHIGPLSIPVWLIRWAFRRVSRLYGLIIMPRAAERTVGRAAAIRRLAEEVRAGESVGLVPEVLGKGTLIEAVPGTGLVLLALSRGRVPIVPVGLWEDDEMLMVRFGEPFALKVGSSDRQEQDRQARERVMVAIGRLLPERYWGFYADAIDRELKSEPPRGG
jgi:hypothetical protein